MDEIKTGGDSNRAKQAASGDDWMAEVIILSLLFVFLGIIGFALYSAAFAQDETYRRTAEVVDRLLPMMTGLVGAGLGFSLTSRKRSH